MLQTTLRNLGANKLRLLTTALAIVLGVAFTVGTLVLTDTIEKTFDDLFADVYADTDAVVRAEGAFEDPEGFGEQRGRIDAALLDTVTGVDGVAAAEGGVFGHAQLVDKRGEPLGDPSNGAPTMGGNWSEIPELQLVDLVDGRGPRTDDEVVIDKMTADDAGYRVGDTATVLVKGGPREVEIVGISRFGDADSPAGASFVLFTPAAAQRLIAEPGRFDSISVIAEDGISQQELVGRLQRALPDGTEAVTGKAITEESQDAIEQGLSFFSTFMLIFAGIALLVGLFMIFNSFYIIVAQRTREHALLRAIGASRRQVLVSVLFEAVLVGVVASAVGVAAGVGVAALLKALLGGIGFELPEGGVVFTPATAVTGFVTGLLVTIVAAVSPARKAAKIAPVEAMRDVPVGSTGYGSKERIMVGSAILVTGVTGLFYGLFGSPANALVIVGTSAVAVFVGVAALGRTIALPLSRVIGWPLPHVRGLAGNLARENAMRNPKRTAATASALMVGVGVVSFFTIFIASTKASFSDTVDKVFTGDFVISAANDFGMGGVDPMLAEQVQQLPEVEAATGIRGGLASVDGKVERLLAVDPATAFDIVDVDPLAGSPADLGPDAIAVFEDVAEEKGLEVGDTVPVLFRERGEKELTVALVYGENQPAGDWLLGIPAYEANFSDQFDFQIFVKKSASAATTDALAAIEAVAAGFPGADVLDQSGYKEEQTAFLDQLLALIYAMLALAIVIALLGIGNTLALSIIERTRELGVLRAVGMTRSQLRSTIRWESAIIAVQGALLGLLIGVFFGWALVRALSDEGIGTFAIPGPSLLVILVLAALAGVVAAILPSRRAAKLDVLRAVVTE